MTNSIHIIDEILSLHQEFLGKDLEKYQNHVYRVYGLCLILDPAKENVEKYAIAAVFHDLGIWTNSTFDYLEPSIAIATNYLKEIGKSNFVNEISLMIDMHHKRSKYKGEYQKTIETFRKADWIDVTKGKKLFGVKKEDYKKITAQYPNLGFHKFLLIQTVKQFFKSPFNPLPMFKK